MPFQQVPNTVSIEIRYAINGLPIENIYYAEKTGGYTQSNLDALAEAVEDWFVADVLPHLASNVTYREVAVRGLNDATDLQSVANAAANTAGAAGAAYPGNVAKAFKLSSGLTGRNARGRIFLGGLPTGAAAAVGYLQQTFVDDILDALEALKVIFTGLGWLWVVVSRYKDGVKRATAETFLVADVSVTNLTTDSMRGRLPKS